MALTPLHIRDYCTADSQQCRYLCWEIVDGVTTAFCIKRAQFYYRKVRLDMYRYGVDLDDRPDNCQGFPLLKHKLQGYDIT